MENAKRYLNRFLTWIVSLILIAAFMLCIPVWNFLFGEYDPNDPPINPFDDTRYN